MISRVKKFLKVLFCKHDYKYYVVNVRPDKKANGMPRVKTRIKCNKCNVVYQFEDGRDGSFVHKWYEQPTGWFKVKQ